MPTMLGRGECGGHLTLVFTIEDSSDDLLWQGSRGVGICVEDGVEAIAKGESGGGSLIVRFLDESYHSALYQDVLNRLIEELPQTGEVDWELSIKISLPASQGFGMSASGAVAAAIAFQRAMGVPHEECMRRSYMIAHLVERGNSSGLGDTTALSSGGVVRRNSAGSPYSGELLDNGPGESEGWSIATPVLLCWRDKTGTLTSGYIDDPLWKEKISLAGEAEMERIGAGGWKRERWEDLIEASLSFSSSSELESEAARKELKDEVNGSISELGLSEELVALMCMLGESLVVVPKNPEKPGNWMSKLVDELERCGISSRHSRVSRTR
ncbi:MAG: hypothetical protein CMA00_004290 [Methanobacteriota archaeon]|nr:MAG: hypothetical protein CMA00_004290 [Euryarchaeota archaeon]